MDDAAARQQDTPPWWTAGGWGRPALVALTVPEIAFATLTFGIPAAVAAVVGWSYWADIAALVPGLLVLILLRSRAAGRRPASSSFGTAGAVVFGGGFGLLASSSSLEQYAGLYATCAVSVYEVRRRQRMLAPPHADS